MGRRRSKSAPDVKATRSRLRRSFRGICPAHPDDVAERAAPREEPIPATEPLYPTQPIPSESPDKALHSEESDGVVEFATVPTPQRPPPPAAARSAAERPATMSPARRASVSAQRGSSPRRSLSRDGRRASATPPPLASSEGASPARRSSRTSPSPQSTSPAHTRSQPPLSGPSNAFPGMAAQMGDYSAMSYAYAQPRPPLRALPVPDSRLLFFNTQMGSAVPTLMHGNPQHNYISISGSHGYAAPAALPDHFGAPTRLLPPPSPRQHAAVGQGGDGGVGSPLHPARRRSRQPHLFPNEPTTQAFARVPPSAPALHFNNFLSDGGFNANGDPPQPPHDGFATPRSALGSGPTRPASGASLTVSPTLWSSTNVPHEYSGGGAASSTAASGDVVFLLPSLRQSRTGSSHSAASNSLHSCSVLSSASNTSFLDQGPMNGGASPVPLAERAFAPWQNASVTATPSDTDTAPTPLEETSANAATASILLPRRNSSHSNGEGGLGTSNSSFISARLRRGSRETEAAKEVETVANFVARMKTTKRRGPGEAPTPDSSTLFDARTGLTSSSGCSGETPLTISSAGSARQAVTISVPPPPPPLRVSGETAHTIARAHRRMSSAEAPPDGPALSASPDPLPALPQVPSATSPPSGTLNDRDATSTGSGRSNTSYRRRDVKASVEAALANMSNSSAPLPSAASRRKGRGMAVNFLFAP